MYACNDPYVHLAGQASQFNLQHKEITQTDRKENIMLPVLTNLNQQRCPRVTQEGMMNIKEKNSKEILNASQQVLIFSFQFQVSVD